MQLRETAASGSIHGGAKGEGKNSRDEGPQRSQESGVVASRLPVKSTKSG